MPFHFNSDFKLAWVWEGFVTPALVLGEPVTQHNPLYPLTVYFNQCELIDKIFTIIMIMSCGFSSVAIVTNIEPWQ